MAYRASVIKSIQTGSVNVNGAGVTSNTATITAVVLANTMLVFNGQSYSNVASARDIESLRLELTNTTTVTASRGTGSAAICIVYFTVVEYFPGVLKSVQRGTIQMNAQTSANATITAVTLAKSVVMSLGFSTTDNASTTLDFWDMPVQLTATTTVNAHRVSASAFATLVGYQAVEFK